MTQKVLRVGSSAAVTIPKRSMEELGLKIGDKAYVYVDSKNSRIIYSKKKMDDFGTLTERDREVLNWTEDFIERYRSDLKKLARK